NSLTAASKLLWMSKSELRKCFRKLKSFEWLIILNMFALFLVQVYFHGRTWWFAKSHISKPEWILITFPFTLQSFLASKFAMCTANAAYLVYFFNCNLLSARMRSLNRKLNVLQTQNLNALLKRCVQNHIKLLSDFSSSNQFCSTSLGKYQ